MSLPNPYTLKETLTKLRYVLEKTARPTNSRADALALLEKAVSKASTDISYAQEMEKTLLGGSTIQLREWLSVFGQYMEPPRSEFPFYPHTDAVNGIDSALHLIKVDATKPGTMEEYFEWFDIVDR